MQAIEERISRKQASAGRPLSAPKFNGSAGEFKRSLRNRSSKRMVVMQEEAVPVAASA
jgi:hypothetical protein